VLERAKVPIFPGRSNVHRSVASVKSTRAIMHGMIVAVRVHGTEPNVGFHVAGKFVNVDNKWAQRTERQNVGTVASLNHVSWCLAERRPAMVGYVSFLHSKMRRM
jgi:hypothetical protein